MNLISAGKRGALLAPLLLLLVLSLPGSVAHAQATLAMSGTFSQQQFQIPQGAEVGTPGIYVVVFNQGEVDLQMRMASEAPLGVAVIFSEKEFSLKPGGERQVYITVRVGNDAVPGEYQIVVSAQATPQKIEGVTVAPSVAQRAKLTVTGQSALVKVRVTSPDGEPVVAKVMLLKLIEGRESEFAISDTGTLEVKVSPGQYVARAYVAGKKLDEESFEVGADETKTITFTVKTAYLSGFAAVPYYYTETGKLAFAKVGYTINNLYQPMADVETILKVSLDGAPLEQLSLLSVSTLNVGTTSGSQNYIPSQGWQSGTYNFKIELYAQGELYIQSPEVQIVAESAKVGTPLSWPLIGGIIGVLVIIGIIAFLIVRRRGV